MHFLVTTGKVSGDIESSNVLLAGDWCGDPEAKFAEHVSVETLEYPIDHADAVKIKCEIDTVFEELLPKIALAYNDVLGLQKDEKFYKIILGRCIFHFIHNIYEKITLLDSALEKHSEITIESCGKSYAFSTDSVDYCMESYSSDEFNFKMYSGVAEYFSGIQKRDVPDLPPRVKADGPKLGIKAVIKSRFWILLCWLNSLFCKRMTLVVSPCYPKTAYFNAVWFFLKSKGQIVHYQFSPLQSSGDMMNTDLRSRLSKKIVSDSENRLLTIASELLFYFMPTSLVEGFDAHQQESKSWLNKHPNLQRIFTANAIHTDDVFKHIVAEADLKDCWIAQHGSGYGFSEVQSSEEYERMLSTRYFTWGWGERVLPSPKLYLGSCVNYESNKALILTVPTVTRYAGLLESYFISSDYKNTINLTDTFLKALPLDALENILLRQRRMEVLRIYEPEMKLQSDDVDQFHDSLKRAKLHLSNHMGTPVLESLAMNVPTLVVYDEDVHRIRDSAKPYFMMLKDVGILFNDAEKAARHLAVVNEDIAKWWRDEKTQEAVNTFCNRFARSDPDWRHAWLKVFCE